MLEFEEKSVPLSPTELVDVTRENGRNIWHYQDILTQNQLPKIPHMAGASILEIGTGLGNSIPGMLELTGNTGSVVSIDIDRSTLKIAKQRLTAFYSHNAQSAQIAQEVGISPPNVIINISLLSHVLPNPIPPGVTLIHTGASDDLSSSSQLFDCAVSIWVFYQVLDKLRVVHNILRSLKRSGSFFAVSTGVVAFTNREIPEEKIAWLKERVWNTRASRFSWLTGTRELIHWAKVKGIPIRIATLSRSIQLLYRNLVVTSNTTASGRPEGAFFATASSTEDIEMICRNPLLPKGAFVSTRSSSIIPIYYSHDMYEMIGEPCEQFCL